MKKEIIESSISAANIGLERADKIFDWFNIPKEEARTNLVKMIMEDKNLSSQSKTALIYNSRKLAREYANNKAIYEQAKELFENKDGEFYNQDWLAYFFDYAKNISNEQMQSIWARLLAGEYNSPGSLSRRLIHKLSIMDSRMAITLNNLFRFVVHVKKMDENYVGATKYESTLRYIALILDLDEMEDYDIMHHWLLELENDGFIKFYIDSHFGVDVQTIILEYFGTYLKIQNPSEQGIRVGHVLLTPLGEEFYEIMVHEEIPGLVDRFSVLFKKSGYDVSISDSLD